MKRTSVHVKNMSIKQLRYHKGLRFCYGFPGAKSFWDLRETGPRLRGKVVEIESNTTKALKKNHALSVRRKKECYTAEKRHTPREKKQLLHGWVISRTPSCYKQSYLYQIPRHTHKSQMVYRLRWRRKRAKLSYMI